MQSAAAIIALAALAQDTRLAVFRLLVQAGPTGVSAGEIAVSVGAAPSTLSHHLGLLERAGLAVSRRQGRMLFYAADYAGTRALLGFLVQDCCQGRADLCPIVAPAAAIVCCPETV